MLRTSDERLEDHMEGVENGHNDPYGQLATSTDQERLVKLRCPCGSALTGTAQIAATIAATFTTHEQRCTAMRLRQTVIRSIAFVLCTAIVATATVALNSGTVPW